MRDARNDEQKIRINNRTKADRGCKKKIERKKREVMKKKIQTPLVVVVSLVAFSLSSFRFFFWTIEERESKRTAMERRTTTIQESDGATFRGKVGEKAKEGFSPPKKKKSFSLFAAYLFFFI